MLTFDKTDSQTTDNPFIVIPEELGVNQLSIIKNKFCLVVSIIVPLSFLVPGAILLGVFRVGIIIPVLLFYFRFLHY